MRDFGLFLGVRFGTVQIFDSRQIGPCIRQLIVLVIFDQVYFIPRNLHFVRTCLGDQVVEVVDDLRVALVAEVIVEREADVFQDLVDGPHSGSQNELLRTGLRGPYQH